VLSRGRAIGTIRDSGGLEAVAGMTHTGDTATAAMTSTNVLEELEVMGGELDMYQELYWELRSVMDAIRARVNAGEAVSDREVVRMVPLAARAEVEAERPVLPLLRNVG
jgi:hypothetical protein